MKYWLETLGCPKNQVDSDKLSGLVEADGYVRADGPGGADLVIVNTCAFIEAARQESVDVILELAALRRSGARLAVTGCMAERYGDELARALPEADVVAGFGSSFYQRPAGRLTPPAGQPVGLPSSARRPSFDLLNLPRPPRRSPWAYVKVAEGCDRKCGFCAIPSFRGSQRSRSFDSVIAEVDALEVEEVVLVAQDLASYGRDRGQARSGRPIETLVRAVAERVSRVRLLYLYPSELTDGLIDVIGGTGCAYFDLSLQHVSRPLLRKMRRWGDGQRFMERLGRIRSQFPGAALRSSFIVGYPGEVEEDHEALLTFLAEAQLDWAGFFAFSNEEGTYAATLPGHVPPHLVAERLGECQELQDQITARQRLSLVGEKTRVLVDRPGVARSHREAPEIDGIVTVPDDRPAGVWADVVVTGAFGTDLRAEWLA
ncbi:MAG: MiaB/RimO family radical SAM methylthiotransferase [Acidimicrobiales bacterium]